MDRINLMGSDSDRNVNTTSSQGNDGLMSKVWWKYDMGDDKLLHAAKYRAENFKSDMGRFYEESAILNRYYEKTLRNSINGRSRNENKNISKSWNLLRIAVDAHYNMVAKFNMKVTFLTKGAKIKISELAKKADEWILHLFNQSGIHEQARDAFKDALVSNLGVMKIMPDLKTKSFTFSRIMPESIAMERPYEGSTNRKEFLEFGMFSFHDIEDMLMKSDSKDAEKKLKEFRDLHKSADNNTGDTVLLYEMYRVGKKKIIFTDKMVLEYSDWKYDWFPYVMFVWDKKKCGVIGTGPAELVLPAQMKIQNMLYRIDKNTELFSNHYVIFDKNSNFQKFSNDFGVYYEANMMQGRAAKPLHITPPIIHEQVFSHLENTYAKGLKVARVSDLQGDGRVPVGLNQGSGVALQHYNNIDNSKFVASVKLYEKTFIESAKICLQWGCDLFKSSDPFKKLYKDKEEFLKSVNKYASNLLPDTPAGRFDALSQLLTMQIIGKEEFLQLLDAPDITAYTSSFSARISAIKQILESKFYNNEPATPDPVLGYAEQKQVAQRIYASIAKESEDGIDDKRLEVILKFLSNIKEQEERIKVQQMKAISEGVSAGKNVNIPTHPSADPNKTSAGGQNRQ